MSSGVGGFPACVCWPETAATSTAGVHVVRPGEPPTIVETRRLVRDWAAAVGVGDGVAERIVLAVDEAVTNAVEHGCPGRSCRIELAAGPRTCGGGVAVLVSDDGVWQPPGDPGYRGRGLQLMRELADRSAVTGGDDGTTVRMCWSAPAP